LFDWWPSWFVHRIRVLLTTLLVLTVAGTAGGVAADTATPTGDCSFPVTVTDATGAEVTIDSPPERVVTLAPSAAQTMWEIGAREQVVGVSKYASYLEGADSRAQISTTEQLVSVEAVANQRPDLVLAPNIVEPKTIDSLRDVGITVYAFQEAETIADVDRKTRRIGRLTGNCAAANTTAAQMQARIDVARQAAQGQDRPDVIYLFFGYTAGNGTFINELITAAGGDNVAADANVTGYRQVDGEFVLEHDPDWIVKNSENPVGIDGEILNQTTAGRQNQSVVVQIQHINQPAPRIAIAVTRLAKRFHPDAYAAANATATPAPSPSPSPEPATQSGETAASGPGFGGIVALVAVLAGLFLARRPD
jgi:iron complex transport system substrate-binding protein